ncbi:MAG: DUF4342 domain-containing protein [Clostridium sp.]
MKEITLEMVDQVKARTGVTYAEAKKALEECGGDVLEAIIYIESSLIVTEPLNNSSNEQKTETVEELKEWIKDLINKGNVSRIKIKKDDQELVDVPVNAGIAATVIAVVLPPILAFGVIAAVATQITIEITREDGSVEIVNKYVAKAAGEVKEKASIFASKFKSKVNDVKNEVKREKESEGKVYTGEETVYTYTVNFESEEN